MLQKLFLLTAVVVTIANGQTFQPNSQAMCPSGKLTYISPLSGGAVYCTPGMASVCPTGYQCTYTATGYYICCSTSGSSSNIPVEVYVGGYCGFPNAKCITKGAACINSTCNCQDGAYYNYMKQECAPIPKLGESCESSMSCATQNSVCLYDSQASNSANSANSASQIYNYNYVYKCKCDSSRGYFQDGSSCSNKKKALAEACTEDAACKASYSYCKTDTKKCDCRPGYTKDGNGCKPTAVKCSDGSDPVKNNGKIVECNRVMDNNWGLPGIGSVATNSGNNQGGAAASTIYDPFSSGMKDIGCDADSYCITYDQAYSTTSAGFCCKKPPVKVPQCPTGQIHESCKAPNYGCFSCPNDSHFCFEDSRVSRFQVCCPKPCPGSDIYNPTDGQCYTPVAHGEACDIDAQCTLSSPISYSYSFIPYDAPRTAMKCKTVGAAKKCSCDTGCIESSGQCVQAKCSSGQPRTDKDGTVIRCGSSYNYNYNYQGVTQSPQTLQTCPSDHQCDNTYSVCCPLSATCPAGLVATSQCSFTSFPSSGCAAGSSCISGTCCKSAGSISNTGGITNVGGISNIGNSAGAGSIGSCTNTPCSATSKPCPAGYICNNGSCCAFTPNSASSFQGK